jgi:hypothetical protein
VNAKYNEFFDSYAQGKKIVFHAPDLDVEEGEAGIERAVKERVAPLLDRVISTL